MLVLNPISTKQKPYIKNVSSKTYDVMLILVFSDDYPITDGSPISLIFLCEVILFTKVFALAGRF